MPDPIAPTPAPGNRHELALRGEVDLHTAPDIERDGMAALTRPAVDTLAINLSGVTFIDSTGIGALVRLRLAADKTSKHLVLRHPSSQVQRVLHVTALQNVFTIENAEASK